MAQISFDTQINGDIPPIVNASEHHMALLFLLDTSGSMDFNYSGTKPIVELTKAINRFKADVCKDEQTCGILDVAVITYNSENNYNVIQDFSPVEYMKPVELIANGTTFMCDPLNVALDMVTERSKFYRRTGTEPYKPWIIIITDGLAMDDAEKMDMTIRRVNEMTSAQKVAVWSLIDGASADDPDVLQLMHEFCGKRVLKLKDHDFSGFFDWANKSMRAVSVSSPGEKVKGQELPDSVTIDDLM